MRLHSLRGKLLPSFLALGLASSAALAPKKADAGLLIGALTGHVGTGVLIGAATIPVSFGVYYLLSDKDGFGAQVALLNSLVIGIPAILLGVDAPENAGGVEGALRAAFPFIDSADAIHDLTDALLAESVRASDAIRSGETVHLRLAEATTREILLATSLSGAQVDRVASVLAR